MKVIHKTIFIMILILSHSTSKSITDFLPFSKTNTDEIKGKLVYDLKGDILKIKSAFIDSIKKQVKDPFNILFFVLGIANTYNSEAENIYKKAKNARDSYNLIKKCFQTGSNVVDVFENLDNKSLYEKIKEKAREVKNLLISSPEAKYNTCKSKKAEILDFFTEARRERAGNSFIPSFIFENVEKLSKSFIRQNICNETYYTYSPLTKKKIRESNFQSIEEFFEECNFLQKIDCEDFLEKGVISIFDVASNIYQYYDAFSKAKVCILGIIEAADEKLSQEISSLKDVFTTSALSVLEKILGGILHFITGGAYGSVRGAYHIYQFALNIHDLLMKELDPFKLGNVIGEAIRALSLIISGSGRR